MVVTLRPATLDNGVMQARVGAPSTCTVQAPHSALPQPNLVPVMPSTSRNTQSSGVSSSTSTLCCLPLILTLKAIVVLRSLGAGHTVGLAKGGAPLHEGIVRAFID